MATVCRLGMLLAAAGLFGCSESTGRQQAGPDLSASADLSANADGGAACCGPGCLDCSAATVGHACVIDVCGCNAASDCAPGLACNGTTHKCTTQCSASQPCNGGCCLNGLCSDGKTQ